MSARGCRKALISVHKILLTGTTLKAYNKVE